MPDVGRRRSRVLAPVIAVAVAGVVTGGAVALEVAETGSRPAGPASRRGASASSATPTAPSAPPRAVPGSTTPTTVPCPADPTLAQPSVRPSGALAGALDRFLGHPAVAGRLVGVSVWVDGLGEVLAHEPDLGLAPASNEKLFTAMGALAVLGPDAVLRTEVQMTDAGDLVVVGGGDATITRGGPHSVDALAEQIQAAGISSVPGALVVDERRHDGLRRAPGWFDWQIPRFTGPLSAFMVDRNRWRSDAAFLADPALANADLLRFSLATRGIAVAGPTIYATGTAAGRVVASLATPVRGLVPAMLTHSDNQIADLLLKEIGYAATGEGSLAAGFTATTAALAPTCVPLVGVADDGSGLSRANIRSAREWRTLLQAARAQPWWPDLVDGLPVAGRTGTLGTRLRGTPADGVVRAKTGTIIGGAALSGYGTTAGGRAFVFSIIVNGEGAEGSSGAIDALVAAIAAEPG